MRHSANAVRAIFTGSRQTTVKIQTPQTHKWKNTLPFVIRSKICSLCSVENGSPTTTSTAAPDISESPFTFPFWARETGSSTSVAILQMAM